MQAKNLEQYMTRYGSLLGMQAQQQAEPLHVPGKHEPVSLELLREPYEPQAHVITAGAKQLRRAKNWELVAECGTGKTLMGMATVQAHANGRGYNALVYCPPHLCAKWEREIRQTIPGAQVVQVRGISSLLPWRAGRRFIKPAPRWFIISRTTAKMGKKWRPAYTRSKTKRDADKDLYRCPSCHDVLMKEEKDAGRVPVTHKDLEKHPWYCEACGEAIWQFVRNPYRWPVASYIQTKMRGFFRYLVVDEMHQDKADDSAQANAMGKLAASCGKVIGLTGTLIGGRADHLRTLLFRLAPGTLVADELTWKGSEAFNQRYGRIETRITEKEATSARNRYSAGSQTRTNKSVVPGVMPTLFGDHLIGHTTFLSLDELTDNLPELVTTVHAVEMDDELAEEYGRIERALSQAIKDMVRKGNRRLLSIMLQTLLSYPDRPYGYGEIGYYEFDEEAGSQEWVHVVTPKDLDPHRLRPKEQALVKDLVAEFQAGRQAWAFTTMTDKRDVMARLQHLLSKQNLRVGILRSGDVSTSDREAWIEEHGASYDVMLSHPKLVETGLDLFDKGGKHNYCTLPFYLTGYDLFTLRQASRRAWRLGQTEECRVKYFYYRGTMQERAMTLMGKKLQASEAIEGKFSSEGLAAMAGDEGNMEMALARSLVEKLDDLDAARAWRKFSKQAAEAPPPRMPVAPPVRKPVRREAATADEVSQLLLFDFTAA